MNVVKRNGSTEPLSIEKIHKVTAWACNGLEVSQSELETEANLLFFDGIKTSDIHEALINSAATLTSVNQPDFTFVAARLLLQKLYKEVADATSYPTLRSYIEKAVSDKRLNEALLEFDLEQLNEHISADRDLQFNYLGLQTVYDRYLIRSTEKSAEGQSPIIELPQHFFMRVAMGLALNETDKNARAIEFYTVLSTFEFMSSTPTLFNAGTLHSQLSSCYLNTVEDSIDGIYGTIHECANLSKYAGGIGTDWTRIRPSGDVIKGTNGRSSGVVPYLKVFNDTAVAVNQCFAPETLVRVSDGVKQIKNVKVGDLVLGMRGEYREVMETLTYPQKDPMVSIKVKHSIEPLLVTSGHPIYAIKGVAAEQSLARTIGQIDAGKHVPEWVEAGNLKPNDYVAQAIPTQIVPVAEFTEDDARLYGIMLGDGHCSLKPLIDFKGDSVVAKEYGVTGSSAEEETLVFVAEYLTARGFKFGYVTCGSGATQIKWSYGGKQQERNELGKFLKGENCLPFDHNDLYDQDGNKRISARFMHLPLPQALAIVRGLIDSDGCVSRGKEITFTNTSLALIEGLRYQMLRLGVPTAGNKRVQSNEHLGYDSITTSWSVRIPAVTELAQALGIPELTKFNWFKLNGMLFSRVSSVENIDPVPTVHDLKIDGDHTYSTTSALVHNGGKRNGAFAAYLEPWHSDLYDFCDLKKNSGDERRRAHDIFPALWMPDLFFKRVKEKGMWSFFSSSEHPELHELYGDEFEAFYEELEAKKAYRSQKPAIEVWRKILTSLFETGHPWITMKDECNRRNPQSHVGVIHNSNLCTEITLNTSDTETSVCNLGSVNLSLVNKADDLKRVIKTAIRMLDNVIDINFYPSERAKNSNMLHRPIGLGVMGYTEYLVSSGIDWESEAHLEAADKLFEQISYYSIEASADLATERGAYPSFAGSKWSKGVTPIDTAKFGQDTQRLDWTALREKVKLGMRNSNVMAIAPTATISNIIGTTPCIEPIFVRQYTKSNLSGSFIVVDPCLKYGKPELCKESFEIDTTWIVRSAAVRQKWIDQAQSVNIFVKAGIKGKDLAEIYMLAWELGLKTTYYLRSQSSEVKMESGLIQEVALPQNTDKPADTEPEPVFCSISNPECESCQ